MNRLTELGIKYDTDKATGHGFTDFYHDYLVKYVNPIMLEVGIYNGASLKMWEEFYGYPLIVAVDIEDKKQYNNNNIKTIIADQGNPEDLRKKCEAISPIYDIIIDDGSHIIEHQIRTLATMYPLLTSGGTYIVEDIHTSFIAGQYNPNGDLFTTYDLLYRISQRLEIDCPYITKEQLDYIVENTDTLAIYQKDKNDYMHSMTSLLVKK